jgi:ankyrin repeat protein
VFGDNHGQIKQYTETAVSEDNYPLAKELVRGVGDIRALAESTRNSLLIMAASHGDADLGRRLIEANPSRSHRRKVSLMTPIHCAAEGGYVELVSLLADAGFVATSETQFGQTALHFAAANGHTAIIKRLGGVVSTKVKDKNGNCPIHWAAIRGHSACIRALIDLGSYVDPLDDDAQRTPLQWAVEGGHADCVRILLERGSDARAVDLRSCTCLHLASLHDRVEVLQLVLPRLADMVDHRDSLGFTALQYAKSRLATKLLRQHGASTLGNESLGMSGLEVFALRGNVYLVEELLSQSPHLRQSKKLITKLFMVSWEEPDHEVFDYLLGLRPGLELLDDSELISLLAECIVRSDEHRILALLRAAFSLGMRPPSGTAERLLAIACKSGFLETVRLLAEIPGIHDLDLRGRPPLLVACKHGHLQVVESLLESGANPSAVDPSKSQSAVEIATAAEHKKIVESLEEYIRFQGSKKSRSLRSRKR